MMSRPLHLLPAPAVGLPLPMSPVNRSSAPGLGPLLCRLTLLLLGLSAAPRAAAAAAWDLVLLHTNDVHARVEETTRSAGTCTNSSRCFGGVARRSTAVRRVRAAEPHVLLLDAGDQFQGTVWFNVYRGAEAAHYMDTLKYDAMALGNHEFDNGVEGLLSPFLEQVRCPVLSANIRPDPVLAPTFGAAVLPYKILEVGGRRVGVVGYTSRETADLSRPGPHLTFEDEVTSLQPIVDKLRTLRVDLVVALGHSGFTVDQEVARRVRGVDVVIGGHTNTFLYTGSPPSSEVPAGPYPFMVRSEDGRQVPVVQAYAFGKYLGFLKLSFDDRGKLLTAAGNPILLDNSVPQDPVVLADVKEWKKKLANYSAQEVGRTLVLLDGETEVCRFGECNLGNLICDAMVDNNIRFPDDLEWNHVSASILNGGGIRASVDEQARNGSITMEDLISVLPFGGTYDLVRLKGSTLRKAFEHSVRRYGQGSGEFLQVSGLRVELDLSRPPGRRVTALSILCTECRVPSYLPVQDQVVYQVVLTSYMVTGGDGFTMIRDEILKHNSGDLDLSVVSRFISQRKKVYPAVEGRIRVLNGAAALQARGAAVLLVALWSLCALV